MTHELVLILDFGGQYTQLIARRVRESKVYCEILPFNVSMDKIKAMSPNAIILSGGSSSVYEENAPKTDPALFGLGIPVLGICYGMQLMAHQLGGKVAACGIAEYGSTDLCVTDDKDIFNRLDRELKVWMSHKDHVTSAPIGFRVTAETENTKIAAFSNPAAKLYGIQFHPEVIHTPQGMKILRNFLYDAAGLKGEWSMKSFVAEAVNHIREIVKNDEQVVCGLSGGVDSSVAASLVHKAIGDRLTCIFVDHGLLRLHEAEQVMETFAKNMNIKVKMVDASDNFLSKLADVTDPERKRKIIGDEFIRTFEREASKLGKIDFLVQGTVYPDVIESGTATTAVIKSHHNVGGLPGDMSFKLIEPLRQLFKDEVREVGRELGLPNDILRRHPFPGPGLAIRMLGSVTAEKLTVLRKADAILTDEIKKAGVYDDIWQAFAVLPDVLSVGVMGDSRTYAYTIALRAVTSFDGMTADWYRFPHEILTCISNRLVNEIPQINRVVYDITSKPPSTIEWE